MSFRGVRLLAVLLIAVSLSPACRGRRVRGPEALDATRSVGLYKARYLEEGERSRRFRLLLFAAAPDRLHGEVISPVGTTELIVDAGDGRIAVTPVDERVSFVGPAEAAVFEVLFGIPVELSDLVAAILEGRDPGGGVTMTREPSAPGLPSRLEIAHAGRVLSLELRREQPLAADARLGRGESPAGMEIRPLDELDPSLAPVRAAEEIPDP